MSDAMRWSPDPDEPPPPLLHIDLTDLADDPVAARVRVEGTLADWWRSGPELAP